MFGSDSEPEEFIPAVLNRPKVANHVIHETFTVDTRDHEDHTFCGIMFDVICKGPVQKEDRISPPLEFLEISAVSIRGDLGPITVWTTPGGWSGKEHEEKDWVKVYEREHEASRNDYARLELDAKIKMAPGDRCGLYVHSKLPGDDAIVYDDQRSHVTYEDSIMQVLPGQAHLSNRPFGRHGMWGFPWRTRREFVGRISYGVGYTLWNPDSDVHSRFPPTFQKAVMTCLLCSRRTESPLYWLQDSVLFYIFNMCKYDWFECPTKAAGSSASVQAAATTTRDRSSLWGFQRWGFGPPRRAMGGTAVEPDPSSSSEEEEEESDSGASAEPTATDTRAHPVRTRWDEDSDPEVELG